MSEETNVQELLKQGIELAREGNKAEARKLFEQVTELDDQNEKGWYWLASVVTTDEERRICLSNVLLINPNNERAQKLMAQLEAKAAKSKSEEEVFAGITRRQLMIFGGGGAVIILLAIVALVAIVGGNNAREAALVRDATSTAAAFTAVALQVTTDAENALATQVALASPTPTPTNTPDRPTLPPEFTAAPTATPTSEAQALPPLPPEITGNIVAASGRDTSQVGYLPIVVYSLTNGQSAALPDIRGRDPVFSADGQRVAYTSYFAETFDFGLGQSNANGTDPKVLTTGMSLLQSQTPSYCAAQNIIAFVALPTGEREVDFSGQNIKPYQVFTLNLDTNELRRLTNDQAVYSYPALSPDCSRIVAVRDDVRGVQAGADIVLIDTIALTQTAVTQNFGNYVESSLRWTPDGSQIIYAAHAIREEGNNNIFIQAPDPNATPLVLVSDASDDRYPVLSPDGRFLAFSSNRNGAYDIYILDQTNSTVYQMTNSPDEDFPGGWAQ